MHRAHVKTSMYSGVYLTNDEIVERAAPDTSAVEVSDLEKENARLRERIAELEAEEQSRVPAQAACPPFAGKSRRQFGLRPARLRSSQTTPAY